MTRTVAVLGEKPVRSLLAQRNTWFLFLAVVWLCFGGPKGLVAEESVATAEPGQAENEEPDATRRFVRVVMDEEARRPSALQTAIVSYRDKDGGGDLRVDLIGAIHVGDPEYYDKLNDVFEGYDVLLYELVAPEGTVIPKGGRGRSSHPIGILQDGMSSLLELVHQLEYVDYTKDNFVHADMSPDEFAKSMNAKGESFLTMYFRMVGVGLAMQAKANGPSPDAEILAALFSSNRPLALKRALAGQLVELEWVLKAFEGDQGSTIIAERNRRAFEVLKRQVEKGEKKIGVFYGAGHLPDMEERLQRDFGLERGDTKWLTAWNMADDTKGK
jgi:hypothetical protein